MLSKLLLINAYITTEIDSINAELARFNEELPKCVTDTFEALKTKFEEKNKAKDDLNPYN